MVGALGVEAGGAWCGLPGSGDEFRSEQRGGDEGGGCGGEEVEMMS